MELLTTIVGGWLLVALMMTTLWLVQRRTGNAAIVDVGWPTGVPLLAVYFTLMADAAGPLALLATGAAVVWGLRLGGYIYFTRIHGGQPEEGRYQALREEWGERFQARLFGFYHLQGALDVVFALPFLLLSRAADAPLGAWGMAGLALWGVAVGGESLADWQLHRFKAEPANRGRVCQAGLWNYSRHPNYFFELLVWVAYALLATAVPWGWLAWLCPALMAFFLFRVTGIPATEAQAERSKGAAYRDYKRTTSAFVPWLKRGARAS